MNKPLTAWLITALGCLLLSTAMAQSDTTAASAPQAAAATVPASDSAQAQTIRKLVAIKQALEDKRERVRAVLEQLAGADEIDQQKLRTQIDALRATIDALTRSFENIAVSGVNLRSLDAQPEQKLSWHDELMQVARPLLNSLK